MSVFVITKRRGKDYTEGNILRKTAKEMREYSSKNEDVVDKTACSFVCGYHELHLKPQDGRGRLLRYIGIHTLNYTESQDCNFDIYVR
jgi:hypothetical protein